MSGRQRAWFRRLRSHIYSVDGSRGLTVAGSGCLGTCPAGGVAVLVASPDRGCWVLPPVDRCDAGRISAFVAHPAFGLPGREPRPADQRL